jgi:uncharacterized protein
LSHFFKALRIAAKATIDSFGPGQFTVETKKVTCTHCGHQEFVEGSAQLNTAGMTFIGLDWANKSAYTLLCTKCSHIEWFMQNPEKL